MTFASAAKFIPVLDDTTSASDHLTEHASSQFEELRFASLSKGKARQLDEAYSRGYEEGKAAAIADMEGQIEQEREHNKKQLELERYTWASRETDALTERIDSGFKEIETKLADIIARILRPFLTEVSRNRAIAELLSALDMILAADEGVTLEISGPEDLLELLREKLNSRNIAVLFTPSDEPEVRMVAGQTIVETCLGQWVQRVEESLK